LPDGFDFDGAVIVTPPREHYRLALPLLLEDKYVLVEKPTALTYQEAATLADYPKCMAGLVYLYHPEVERLRDMAVGMELSHAFSRRTNQGPIRPGLDAAWDLAPHDISIFNYIFQSKPYRVGGLRYRDWCVLRLDYPYTTALVYVSWHGAPKMRRVELVPKDGERIIFDDLAVVLEEPPLTRMIKAFLSGKWDRCFGSDGADVTWVLEMVK
jgi:predicted dehydrogenase